MMMFLAGAVLGAGVTACLAFYAIMQIQDRMKRLGIWEVWQNGVPEDVKARARREGTRAHAPV